MFLKPEPTKANSAPMNGASLRKHVFATGHVQFAKKFSFWLSMANNQSKRANKLLAAAIEICP
jgi:hypothetical protein